MSDALANYPAAILDVPFQEPGPLGDIPPTDPDFLKTANAADINEIIADIRAIGTDLLASFQGEPTLALRVADILARIATLEGAGPGAAGDYGSIELVASFASPVDIALGTGSPSKITGWTADGPSSGATPAFGSDQITIGAAGDYRVTLTGVIVPSLASKSFTGFDIDLFVNAVAASKPRLERIGQAGQGEASVTLDMLITLAATDVLDVRAIATGVATTLRMYHMNLAAHQVG